MAERPASTTPGPQRRQSLAEQVRQAEQHTWQGAYAAHRARVLSQRGVPVFASRGRGDCLALVLLPLGLILLAVHPLPATLVLILVAWLVLSGSDRLRQERGEIAEAETEALRLWLQAGHDPPVGMEEQARALRRLEP